jgi:hypothetical protein
MWRKTPQRSRETFTYDVRAGEQTMRQPGSRRSALLRNNFSNIPSQKTLQGGVGISMAVIEEVTSVAGNFANARTFPLRHAGADSSWGVFYMIEKGD